MITPNTRDLYPIEQGLVYLDNGGFGLAPLEVTEKQREILADIERSPKRFFAYHCDEEWHKVRKLVAKRFSVDDNNLALVKNTTTGINGILRALQFKPSDEIIITSLIYGAIENATRHIAEPQGAKVIKIDFRFPNPSPEQCIEALDKAITPKTKLAIFDHIASFPGLVLPIKELADVCRKKGVISIIDGAHAPGQVELNINGVAPDFYVANIHKWYGAPRGCGFVWADPKWQANLKPAVISWNLEDKYPDCFRWTGTDDPSAWLSIPAAFDFVDRKLGGEENLRKHNHDLVLAGGALLAKEWGTKITTPESMTGCMLAVPLPEDLPYALNDEKRVALQRALSDRKIENCMPLFDSKRHYIRTSAYAYNDIVDFERLAETVSSMRIK